MQSLAVVSLDSGRDPDLGMGKAKERRFVQQFIEHLTIEAIGESVLHGFARRYLVPFQADLPAPCRHRIAGELFVLLRLSLEHDCR